MIKKLKIKDFFVSLETTDRYIEYYKLPAKIEAKRVNEYNVLLPATYDNETENGIKFNYFLFKFTVFNTIICFCLGLEKLISTVKPNRINNPIDYSDKFKYFQGEDIYYYDE